MKKIIGEEGFSSVVLIILAGIIVLAGGVGIRYIVQDQKDVSSILVSETPEEAAEKKKVFVPLEVVTVEEEQPEEVRKVSVPTIFVEKPLPRTVITTGDIIADTGSVYLPPKQSSFLISTAKASHEDLHRIIVYLKLDPETNKNQIFYYDLDIGREEKITDEPESIFPDVRVVDYPVSAILYYTKTSFKFIRLNDPSQIRLSGLNSAAHNPYAVSPDGTQIAYFNESSNLVIRNLTTVDLDIVQTYPNPVVGGAKGNVPSPLVYSADGITLQLYKTVVVGGRGASEIVSFNVDDGSVETILSDGTQKWPPSIPFNDDRMYYANIPLDVSSGNLVEFNLRSRNKNELPIFAGPAQVYFDNKVFLPNSSLGEEAVFAVIVYDLATRQKTGDHKITIPASEYLAGYGSPGVGAASFVGLGSDEREFIFNGGGTLYLYDIGAQTLKKLLRAQTILEDLGPRG